MKRMWRFIKWICSSFGWFELYLFSISFCMGGAAIATVQGKKDIATIFYGIAILVVILSMFILIIKAIKFSWKRFKEEEEKVFNILKQDKIK